MTHPLLTAIDEELTKTEAGDVQAIAEGSILSAVQDELGCSGSRVTQYRGVVIGRAMAPVDNGWMVRPAPKMETPNAGGEA